VDLQLKIFLTEMVKLALSNNISTFMARKVIIVLTLIVMQKLKKLFYLVDQVFFALDVKNNKVDPNNAYIYTILKYA